MKPNEIKNWLRETNEQRLNSLWRQADTVRQENVGPAVHLRGLIEISNHCTRFCHYCGLRAPNSSLPRYRMTTPEILACAHQALAYGYGTVVLQAGEDYGLPADEVAALVQQIKTETPLAVTLSLGERHPDELALWRQAGADRYLLRFETSNRRIYDRIHPPRPGQPSYRFALLHTLRDLGYEVGSGVMIGIPGTTFDDLTTDLETFRRLNLDMIGVGPFIAHPDTPLGQATAPHNLPPDQQVPNSELMTYKVIALARLLCPLANIPATTALATLNLTQGRELALARGANVIMPNLTPPQYRALYQIYPAKACLHETPDQCHTCLHARIRSLGRTLATGPGPSPNKNKRITANPEGKRGFSPCGFN